MNAFQAQASQFAELLSSPKLNPSELVPLFLRFRACIEDSIPEWDFVDPQLIPHLRQIEETLHGSGRNLHSVADRRTLARQLFLSLSPRLNERYAPPLPQESPVSLPMLADWLAPSALIGVAGALMLAIAHASSEHAPRNETAKHERPPSGMR